MQQNTYSSKLLLFGEYSIIHGGVGLSVPITQFYGKWSFKEKKMDWVSLYEFLQSQSWPESIQLNNTQLKKDIEKGLYFDSNIPQGYGLGSSAALSAAIFKEYFITKKQLSISVLHQTLAQIESHFHGRSSGIDPLVSYLNQGVLIHNSIETQQAEIELVNCSIKLESYQFFLYDTGMIRNTKNLVSAHKEKYIANKQYRNSLTELNVLNQNAINFLLNQDISVLKKEMDAISQLQQDFMSAMIPTQIIADFKKLKLKLCGAGGGGYFLGLCSQEKYPSLKKDYPLIKI